MALWDVASGLRIRKLRLDKEWTIEDVARLLNIGFSSIAKYERGEQQPPADKLAMLADLYGVSVDYLLGRTNVRKRTPDEQLLDMGIFLRGHGATEEDVRLIKNLIESRKLLKQQAERAQKHPNDKI